MVNRSLNQVLMRSINTSLVAVLPVASLLIVGTYVFGGLVLRDFALALFVGLLTGAYSSIFVATPLLAWLKEREPRYRALRARAASDIARRGQAVTDMPAAAVAGPEPEPALLAAAEADTETDEDVEVPAVPRPAPAAPAAPAAQPTRAPQATGRGTANPRPRQQRGKKRR
jgi:preprotein translocase subunit SecF